MKTILVTGASRGYGRATAQKLTDSGYRVIGLSRTHPTHSMNPNDWIQADLQDMSETPSVLGELRAKDIILDGVVHCACLNQKIAFENCTSYHIIKTLSVNCIEAVQLTRYLLEFGSMNLDSTAIFNLDSRVFGEDDLPAKLAQTLLPVLVKETALNWPISFKHSFLRPELQKRPGALNAYANKVLETLTNSPQNGSIVEV